MEKGSLEEISLKEGKWVNSRGEKVNPSPVGNPVFISKGRYEGADLQSEKKMTEYLVTKDSEYAKLNILTSEIINAYSKGEVLDCYFTKTSVEMNGAIPVQFYKI